MFHFPGFHVGHLFLTHTQVMNPVLPGLTRFNFCNFWYVPWQTVCQAPEGGSLEALRRGHRSGRWEATCQCFGSKGHQEGTAGRLDGVLGLNHLRSPMVWFGLELWNQTTPTSFSLAYPGRIPSPPPQVPKRANAVQVPLDMGGGLNVFGAPRSVDARSGLAKMTA